MLVEEDELWNRPIDALIEVLVSEVWVLVAQKHAQIELAAFLGQPP